MTQIDFCVCACRHYTFYLWKDFFAVHPGAKFTLLPVYLYSAWSVWESLVEGPLPSLGILGLATASCLTLVPAWLLDFRCAPAASGSCAECAPLARFEGRVHVKQCLAEKMLQENV